MKRAQLKFFAFTAVFLWFLWIVYYLRYQRTILRPNIYTYFDSIGFGTDESELLELWKKSWIAYGWNPVVLNINVAQKHPKFDQYREIFSSYPTINPKSYELTCFYRWIAMIVVGGGFMSDIDVMNYGFRFPGKNWDWRFTTQQSYMPSLVSASKEEYQRVVDLLATINVDDYIRLEMGKPHISDMNVFLKFIKEKKIQERDEIVGEDTNKPLTHWSHTYVYKLAGQGAKRAPFLLAARYDPLWNKPSFLLT